MTLGTIPRVGFALLGLTMAGACAQRELDKKPELAQEHGYYVSQKEAMERGGVGGYVDVPSNSERSSLDETKQQAGIAAKDNTVAKAPVEKRKLDKVPALEGRPAVIHFDLGKSTIKEDSIPVLDQLATQMNKAPDVRVKIEGFADKLGTPDANQTLSEERAESVTTYLESKGASSDKFDIASYGDKRAKDPNGNPDDRKVVISRG